MFKRLLALVCLLALVSSCSQVIEDKQRYEVIQINKYMIKIDTWSGSTWRNAVCKNVIPAKMCWISINHNNIMDTIDKNGKKVF